MKNFIEKPTRLLNKVDDGAPGGNPPANAPIAQPPPPANPPPPAPPGNPDDDKYDEHGYEKTPAASGDQKPPGDKSKETPPEKPEKVENPATGYGDDEPKIDDAPAPDPNKPADPPKPPPTDLEKKLEGLNPSFAAKVKAQIEKIQKRELPADKEQALIDDLIADKKQEQKEANDWAANQAAEIKRQEQLRHQAWHKELREDPAFGGEKFALNVVRAEKVLDEYLPELKKELTSAKVVLRPSIMRGLARLADTLYPDRKVVQGGPPAPEGDKGDEKPSNPLDFYSNS